MESLGRRADACAVRLRDAAAQAPAARAVGKSNGAAHLLPRPNHDLHAIDASLLDVRGSARLERER